MASRSSRVYTAKARQPALGCFALAMAAAQAARKLHYPNTRMADSINKALDWAASGRALVHAPPGYVRVSDYVDVTITTSPVVFTANFNELLILGAAPKGPVL